MKKEELKALLNKLGNTIGEDECDLTNKLVEELENNLPFKDRKEHKKWLECLQGFKFWEDFEEMTLNIINHHSWVEVSRSKTPKKYITFNSLQIAWNRHLNREEEVAMRRLFDIYKIASHGNLKNKVSEETFEQAANLYNEYQKLNRQNDNLLVLDNDDRRYNSDYTKDLRKKNDEQETKVRKLAKKMGLTIVYYSHLATLQNSKDKRDLNLNRVL